MHDNSVSVDLSTVPARIEFSPVFNTAVPLIDRHLEEGRGGKVAIRTDSGDVTYAELAERVNRCGNALLVLGAGKGERVLMVVKDCPAFFYLFWGAIKAGILPVPLNTLLRAADYQYLIEDSAAAGIVYSPEYAAEIEPALAAAGHKPGFAIKTEDEGGLAERMAAASAELAPAPAAPEDDGFWVYSSGSTGRPKGAVHRHRNIIISCVHYAQGVLGVTEDDVCFSAAKLFFSYGLSNGMNFPLWVGATVVLNEKPPSPEMTFDVIERFRPTVYYGVPTLYASQLRALESQSPDLSSLRVCVSAGEPLPADIFRRWRDATGRIILDGIGSTEAGHIFISNTLDDHKPGTSGRVVPGYEVKVVDDDGAPVIRGQAGRLLVKGDSTAAYYWNKPDKTAETMVEGWLNTGDTYRQDAEGYFVYWGRSDDMIKVGGIWCSPAEIESRLIEHPKVLEAAVVRRADDDEMVKPEAFIVLNDLEDADDALVGELQEHCKSGLARYKYPRWINFVEDLPKTATGKIQRFKLRDK